MIFHVVQGFSHQEAQQPYNNCAICERTRICMMPFLSLVKREEMEAKLMRLLRTCSYSSSVGSKHPATDL